MGINPSDIFFLDGKKYFFKVDSVGAYRELVIDEFARDLGIRCAEYDLASFSDRVGLMSLDMNTHGRFVPMEDFLREFYHKTTYKELAEVNNLDDIGVMLETIFDRETFNRLMNQLEDVYLFDIFVGHPDRNCSNYGLLFTDSSVDVIIFDNDRSMDYDVIYEDDFRLRKSRTETDLDSVSSEKITRFLEVFSTGNIDSAISRVEEKIDSTINEGIKCEIKTFLRTSSAFLSKKLPEKYVKQI
jgi:hypothetical protein